MAHIYFRDKENVLKGPFEEREIQEWYRDKWFDGEIPFYFMETEESPSDETQAIKLKELQNLYGIGCPFARVGKNKLEEQLESLEEKIKSMKEDVESIKAMEARIAKLEEEVKNIGDEHVAAANTPSTTAKKEDQKPSSKAEEEYIPDWIPHFMEFFLNAYDALANDRDPASYWSDPDEMELVQIRLGHVLQHPPSKAILLRELKKTVSAKDYLFCSPCSRVLQNYKLAFLHLTDPCHEARACAKFPIWEKLDDLLVDYFDIHLATRWLNAENEEIEKLERRFRKVPLNSKTLRPSVDFLRHVQSYEREIIKLPAGFKQTNGESLNAAGYRNTVNKIQGDIGKKIMGEIEEHIKDSQTRCLPCKVVVGSAQEYYHHLLGPCHMNKADPLDIITLVVNAHKKDLAE